MKQNMITGSPSKSLIFFALPMVLGNLFQQLYSMVDSIVVGNYNGEEALAAVGSSSIICFVFIAIAIGLGIGCGVVISQLFGAKQYDKMKTAISTSIITVVIIGALLTFVGLILAKPILTILQTPENIFDDAYTYLSIYMIGFVSMFLYNICNAVFNALGKSMLSLGFLIFSSVLNIGLDLLFVIQYKMGVAGVAWATLISQSAAAILAFIFLIFYIKKIETERKLVLFDKNLLKVMGKIAIPSCIQQSVVSFGLVFMQALINSYGSVVVAGYIAAIRIDGIAIIPMLSIGNAISTYVAQNIGAGKIDRVKMGYRSGIAMSTIICIVLTVLIFIFGEQFISIFMDSTASAEAIAVGVEYLKIVGVFYIMLGLMNITGGVLRGAGDMGYALLIVVVSFTVRVVVSYALAAIFVGDSTVVWLGNPIGWILGFTLAYARYRSNKWKTKAIVGKV